MHTLLKEKHPLCRRNKWHKLMHIYIFDHILVIFLVCVIDFILKQQWALKQVCSKSPCGYYVNYRELSSQLKFSEILPENCLLHLLCLWIVLKGRPLGETASKSVSASLQAEVLHWFYLTEKVIFPLSVFEKFKSQTTFINHESLVNIFNLTSFMHIWWIYLLQKQNVLFSRT